MSTGIAYATLSPAELARRWNELQRDPSAPDFCELDEYGDVIVMNPPRKTHQRIVAALMQQIVQQLGGEALPRIGVLTRIGVRVPGIVWQPQPTPDDPASPAPPLVVEVQSESNTRGAGRDGRRLSARRCARGGAGRAFRAHPFFRR